MYHITDKNYTTTLCGEFTVQQASELGDNITFAFKPDEEYQGAILKWQQTNLEGKRWTTLPLNPKFIQYIKDGVYSLVLTNATFQISKDVSYRVHYYNETMHCLMETPKIIYQGIALQWTSFRIWYASFVLCPTFLRTPLT